MSVKSPLGLVLYCYLNMPTINKTYLILLNQTRINCSFSSIDTKAASVIRLHQLVRIPQVPDLWIPPPFLAHLTQLLSQSQPNFAEMILRWSPLKMVSVSAVLYPRWPPLLKIEISSNGQNCSILSQKVPKFELYKHDELFNIYYGIFYEL